MTTVDQTAVAPSGSDRDRKNDQAKIRRAASKSILRRLGVEPELIPEPAAAAVLSLSVSAFGALVRRGDITPVKIPGMRREAFVLDEVRGLARRWRDQRDAGGDPQ